MLIGNFRILEQRMGRWATAAISEYDIAYETFNPYNNRHLHCLMLAVDERLRKDHRLDVPIRQMESMWPEVLLEPINPPHRLREKTQQFIRRAIIHRTINSSLSVYQLLKYIRLRWRFGRQTQGLRPTQGGS